MDKVISILKENKLKVTLARQLILKEFLADCALIDAEFLFKRLKKDKIDQATIYRTLKTFENIGLIKKVERRQEAFCFELVGHHHHHIICNDCGLVEPITDCYLEPLITKTLNQSKSFSCVKDHNFELFGVCLKCLKK